MFNASGSEGKLAESAAEVASDAATADSAAGHAVVRTMPQWLVHIYEQRVPAADVLHPVHEVTAIICYTCQEMNMQGNNE